MSTIGKRFKAIRTNKDLSQEAFGAELKMTKSGISAVENDKVFVSVDVLRTLFLNFNINLNWFIMGKGNMFNAPEFEDVKDEFEARVIEIMKKQGLVK